MGRPKKNENEVVQENNSVIDAEIKDVIKSIRKVYGDDSIMTFDSSSVVEIPKISSGILPLDMILGGGICLGRIYELFGPESSGKTTIAIKTIASFQGKGKLCAFIDAEHAFDPVYARNLGVDLDRLLFCQPDNGEQALDITDQLVRTGKVSLIIIDSVAALVPKKEIDGDMGDSNVGLHARLMSQAMRKLTAVTSKSECTLMFINQIREKVGVAYGNPETTTGGRALKFYSSVRLDIRKKQTITEGTESVANHVRIKTVKNKTFPPNKECEFNIIYGKGPDDEGSLIDIAVEAEIINKAGAWFTLPNGARFHGAQQIKNFFQTPEGKVAFEDLKVKVEQYLQRDTGGVLEEDEELEDFKEDTTKNVDEDTTV